MNNKLYYDASNNKNDNSRIALYINLGIVAGLIAIILEFYPLVFSIIKKTSFYQPIHYYFAGLIFLLMAGLTYGIYKKGRICSISYFLLMTYSAIKYISKVSWEDALDILSFVRPGFYKWFLPVLLGISVWGTFKYHRQFKKVGKISQKIGKISDTDENISN